LCKSRDPCRRAERSVSGITRKSPITYPVAAAALFIAQILPALAEDTQTLARAAKNPLANLVNVQFLYDANLGVGAADKTQHVLTFQPVIPFAVSDDWSIITRTILPLIAQPGMAPGEGWTNGRGDTQLSAFLSPARGDKLVWGVGPVLQIPSATNNAFGQGKWAGGPTAAAIWYGEQWSFGALINNVWSFAGHGDRPAVNQMELQPQINYNFKDNPDRYLSFSPTITANWKASDGERWTVPVTLGIGQLVKFGRQPVNLQATAYYNVIKPADAGSWTLELTVQFLFPKRL
jgi:hypothetical protein